MELPGKRQYRGRFAQPGIGVDDHAGLDLVAVLAVAFDGLGEAVVEGEQLRRLDRPEVGMPDHPLVVVAQPLTSWQGGEVGSRQQRGLRL